MIENLRIRELQQCAEVSPSVQLRNSSNKLYGVYILVTVHQFVHVLLLIKLVHPRIWI
jgi:hypothetical protein